MLEFVIAGHSHIFAMGAPLGYVGPVSLIPVEAAGSHGYFLMEEWHGGRGATYWDALVTHSVGRAAVLVYSGNQHFVGFLLARRPLFDFVDPMDPGHALYPGAVVVPRRLVKSSPSLIQWGLRDLILRLQGGGCRRVIIAGTPPVRNDCGDYIDELRKIDHWREIAARMGLDLATCDTTPAPIMKRLWGVVQESLADVARETGARFVPVPKEAIDPGGYLSPEYHGDFFHANHAYGRLILDRIALAINEGATEPLSFLAGSGA